MFWEYCLYPSYTPNTINQLEEDIIDYLDLSSATRPNQQMKRVNVDFPVWMVNQMDAEAKRLGVTRQSIIKFWIAERLERVGNN